MLAKRAIAFASCALPVACLAADGVRNWVSRDLMMQFGLPSTLSLIIFLLLCAFGGWRTAVVTLAVLVGLLGIAALVNDLLLILIILFGTWALCAGFVVSLIIFFCRRIWRRLRPARGG
jgi:hypothetical protein